MDAYSFPADLVQGIVSALNTMPASHSRQLLNAVEIECMRQDREDAEAKKAAERAAIVAEVKADLAPKADDKPAAS